MSRKLFTPEEITGKLYEAEVYCNGFKVLILKVKGEAIINSNPCEISVFSTLNQLVTGTILLIQ
jgi:hypothetical protein